MKFEFTIEVDAISPEVAVDRLEQVVGLEILDGPTEVEPDEGEIDEVTGK